MQAIFVCKNLLKIKIFGKLYKIYMQKDKNSVYCNYAYNLIWKIKVTYIYINYITMFDLGRAQLTNE